MCHIVVSECVYVGMTCASGLLKDSSTYPLMLSCLAVENMTFTLLQTAVSQSWWVTMTMKGVLESSP